MRRGETTEMLALGLLSGERRAIAAALGRIESGGAAAAALIDALRPRLGRARIVGFTGPPGAGKSTLVSAYIGTLRGRGARVGVIAVDPSSPFSGGALLGDRVRMGAHAGDPGVFVRSLGSGNHAGGLSTVAVRLIDVFDAAGHDSVILETVGAGQAELDIAEIAETRVVLVPPGLGDAIQAMKAGVLDIADILVVTKADRQEAARTWHELRAATALRGDTAPPVIQVSGQTGVGIDALAAAIEAVPRGADPTARRLARARRLLAWAVAAEAERKLALPSPELDTLAEAVLDARIEAAEAARRVLLPDPPAAIRDDRRQGSDGE